MHPPEVLFRQRERQKSIGLDVVQPQLRGIRGPRGLKRQHRRIGKLSSSHPCDCGIQFVFQRRRRRRKPPIRLNFETDLRIVHQFRQLRQQHVDGVARQQSYVQVGTRLPRNDVRSHACRQHRRRDGIPQHRVPQRTRVGDHSLRVLAAVR